MCSIPEKRCVALFLHSHPCHRRRSSMNKDSRRCLVTLKYGWFQKKWPLSRFLFSTYQMVSLVWHEGVNAASDPGVFSKKIARRTHFSEEPHRSLFAVIRVNLRITHRRFPISWASLLALNWRLSQTDDMGLRSNLFEKRLCCVPKITIWPCSVCQNFRCYQIKCLIFAIDFLVLLIFMIIIVCSSHAICKYIIRCGNSFLLEYLFRMLLRNSFDCLVFSLLFWEHFDTHNEWFK